MLWLIIEYLIQLDISLWGCICAYVSMCVSEHVTI